MWKNRWAAPKVYDPIRYFLTKSRQGNSMLYASAAVESLRVHGIPARYVEGYFVSRGTVRSKRRKGISDRQRCTCMGRSLF